MDDAVLVTLMHRLRAGDDGAIDALIAATARELRLHVAWLGCRGDGIEDVLHDTYLAAALHAARWQEDRPVLPWLKGIARHRLLRWLRSHASHPVPRDPRQIAAMDLVAAAPDPRHPLAEALARCLEQLSPTLREALERFYTRDESAGTIAAALGRTEVAVWKSLSRARSALRECLGLAGAAP